MAATTNESTDGAAAERVLLWDGSSWSALGAVADGPVDGVAQASHEDGAVHLGGVFTEVDGVPSEGIARWGCACAADFNGDGEDDVLWRHDNGQLTQWLGQPNGGFADNGSNSSTNVPTSWQVQASDLWM